MDIYRKENCNLLLNNNFLKSNKYDPYWIIKNSMGLNVLWLTEWLCEGLIIEREMKILDLGCGKALSSIYIASEFNAKVWATDLWIKPTQNLEMISKLKFDDSIFPIFSDARSLPYANNFFDAVFCINSYIYFGTDDLYLNYIKNFLKPGGIIGIVVPGLRKEFETGMPKHLEKFWGQDCWSWHTLEWWKQLWERTGLVEIQAAEYLENGCQQYLEWKKAQEKEGKNPWPDDLDVLEKDNGEYIGFIKLVAKKKVSI